MNGKLYKLELPICTVSRSLNTKHIFESVKSGNGGNGRQLGDRRQTHNSSHSGDVV